MTSRLYNIASSHLKSLRSSLSAFSMSRVSWIDFLTIFLTIAVLTLGTSIGRRLRQDYLLYLSYGPGGLPYNIFGWFVSSFVLRALSRDVLSLDFYDTLKDSDQVSFLPADFLLQDRGSRPQLGPHPLPQRQLDQQPSEKVMKDLERRFEDIAARNRALVDLKMSLHEGHTRGIFIKEGLPMHEIAKEMLGEISHIHATGDHSVHVVLAPGDCKRVIKSRWGQRHPLDGVHAVKWVFGWTIPMNYILLYAPRNREEMQTVTDIVKSSIAFMTGTKDVL